MFLLQCSHVRITDRFLFCCVVLSPADGENHVDKHPFKIPFVCGARNLGEALRRVSEGAAMIRTKGEAGTGKGVYMYVLHNRACKCGDMQN